MTMNDSLPARDLLASVGPLLRAATVAVLALVGSAVQAQGFDFEAVDKLARALAAKPYIRQRAAAAQGAEGSQLRPDARYPLRSVAVAVARRQTAVRVAVLPPRRPVPRPMPVRIHEVVGGTAREIAVRPGRLRLRQDRARPCAVAQARLRGFPCAHCAQYASATRTNCWCSWARAISVRWARDSATAPRRVVWRWTPPNAPARSFHASNSSGSCGRRATRAN